MSPAELPAPLAAADSDRFKQWLMGLLQDAALAVAESRGLRVLSAATLREARRAQGLPLRAVPAVVERS